MDTMLRILVDAGVRHDEVAALSRFERVALVRSLADAERAAGCAGGLVGEEAAAAAAAAPVTAADMRAVVEQRCLVCHNAQMQQKNVALHTPELLKQQALSVYQQVSVLKLMPMNNATQITDAERDLVRRWWEAGAPVR